ncbi:GNAT family N-acetyltransferase [Bradyrhizobium sp. BWA-3-5]|uniref:GNAT family N-acetyltransferase n=1 Tax=Bradyrhizobium sp. BWA-3-5 TaxID=3080013 RepID=UPI00293E31A7|nr:GNAT family N-acetyltransferase [Bradyrhizobium sp. BWA-3-5]WOH64758.1 GNAT family N-acetyltransferase [Bradyrhizobium sp. BWA-3-5]
MHIDIIETMPQLSRLEENWNAVYDADDEAQVYLSWQWLSGWLSCIPGPWFILAAKERDAADLPYAGFLPLRLQTTIEKADVFGDIRMAGNFAADYTGLVCRTEAENRVIPAFARTIKQMSWTRLHLDNIRMSERRWRLLTACFPKAGFHATNVDKVNFEKIDNSLCPYAPLPDDWNSFLDQLSANTRQKIRRLLKQVEASSEYRITVATPETFERDLKTLLGFWDTKWRARKADRIDGLIRTNSAMLTRSFQSGLVYLPTFWHGERPVAALATLMEPRKRTFSFYMTGRDETFVGPPAGMLLHAYSIRHAIERGFVEYDFLRGNEPYKYSFGCKERKIYSIVLETRSGRNLGGRIDPRCIPDLLEQATELHRKGKAGDAEAGYRRILEVRPKHADALHRLGQLLAAKPDLAGAKRAFRALTTVRPDAAKAWQCLGQVCERLDQHEEALRHYIEFVRLQTDSPDAFVAVAQCMVKLGRMAEINAALLAAIEPANGASVRKWRDWRSVPDRQATRGQAISA